MGLAQVQAALARLFTDAGLRARFFADPIEVGRGLGLDQSETSDLASLSTGHVADFAATLRRKRVDDLRKLLPLTALALGDSFAGRASDAIQGPNPPRRSLDDAQSLVDHLARLPSPDPPWAPDLASYERSFRLAERMRLGIRVRLFRFPVGRLAVAIHRGDPIPPASTRFRLGVWARLPGRRGVIHRLLALGP